MQHELRCRSGNAFAMRYVIEGPLQFRMLRDKFANLVQTFSRRLQTLFKLSLGLYLGLAESHLHAAVGVDLAFAGGFDGKENHVFEFVDDGRLHAIRLRRRHASEGLERQHHVAEMMDRVVNILSDLEMAFPAARELVVERMRHFGQLCLRHQVMREAAEIFYRAVIEAVPHPLTDAQTNQFLS
jgi:hypothetical protein